MNTESFNPTRLDLARRRRGMTKKALAESVGISAVSMARYHVGVRKPDPDTVAKFAEILRFPNEFFYGSSLAEPPLEGASFRALSTLTARLRDQALAAGALGISLSNWIDERFSLPMPQIPQFDGVDPEAAAMEVRSMWGIGERPIRNTIHLLELHGVRVLALATETAVVDAYSFWRDDVPYIFLNSGKTAERSRMDAAHELGHLVLHWKSGSQRNRLAEKEAHEFGASFLMPRGSVLGRMPWGANIDEIIKAKHYWIVSVANLAYRLHSLRLLTDYQYRQVCIEIGRCNFRQVEPEAAPRERSQVLEKVLQHLRAKKVTMTQVANDLALHPDELGLLLSELVRSPVVIGYPGPRNGAHSATKLADPSNGTGRIVPI